MKLNKPLLLIGGGVLIYIYYKLKKNTMNTGIYSFSKFSETTKKELIPIQQKLIDAGITDPLTLRLILAQVLLETGNFTKKSNVYVKNNNASGIKWLNAPRQKNASKGTPVPPGERSKTNPNWSLNWYAKFNTIGDWALDLVRILKFGAKPIEARTPEDFVQRLSKNRYFGSGDVQGYTNSVKKFYKMID